MAPKLPDAFVRRMERLLGDEFAAFMDSYNNPRYYGLRVNTLKTNAEAFAEAAPFQLTPIPWVNEGYYYAETDRPGKHPFYHAGLYYIQEPSAMLPGELLRVKPGDRVLDLCAAPGGKSTQLAAKLQRQGLLVSNDNSPERVKALVKNIELSGVPNAVVLNELPERMAPAFADFFDKVLIDAPCSGEGMFRKDEDMAKQWERHSVEKCALMQRDILRHAAFMVAPGGTVVYSTCTFAPEENEGTIAAFLAERPDFHVVPVPLAHGFAPGRPDWLALVDADGDYATPSLTAGDAHDEHDGVHAMLSSTAGIADATHDGDYATPSLTAGDAHDAHDGAHAALSSTAGVASHAAFPKAAGEAESALGMQARDAAAAPAEVRRARLASLRGAVRLWPHKLRGEGHFAVVLQREAVTAAGESGESGKSGDAAAAIASREAGVSSVAGNPDDAADEREHAAQAAGSTAGSGRGERAAHVRSGPGEALSMERDAAAARGRLHRRGMRHAPQGGKGGRPHPAGGRTHPAGRSAPPGPDLEPWLRFAADQFTEGSAPSGEPIVYGERLYLQPPGLPSLDGLKVARPGLYAGSLHGGRFEPSHALAMTLRDTDSVRVLRLDPDGEEAIRYLKGETLQIDRSRIECADHKADEKGRCLVCLGRHPIGWGKWQGGMLKNEYPAGWRWT